MVDGSQKYAPAGRVTLKDLNGTDPGNLKRGANSLTVAWNEAMGANSYKVQWKSGTLDYHSSRQKVWTDLMELEYEIPNLEPGTLYTVQVIATNALGKTARPQTIPTTRMTTLISKTGPSPPR